MRCDADLILLRNAIINVLTDIFKGREGEGIICQRLEQVRDVAPVPADLLSCWHAERVVKLPDWMCERRARRTNCAHAEWKWRPLPTWVTFKQLCNRSHHEDAYMCPHSLYSNEGTVPLAGWARSPRLSLNSRSQWQRRGGGARARDNHNLPEQRSTFPSTHNCTCVPERGLRPGTAVCCAI